MPRYRLICKGKGIARRVIELDKPQMTIGKSQYCDLAIPNDDYVSRDHARIVQREGNFFIEDLGSSNGTLLSIQRPTPLQDGDQILVGTCILVFERM
jgi:pSer/pThr/pTyr-binding forkhead associated (FHA) protein